MNDEFEWIEKVERGERFLELEARLADCHDDTQAKLYDLVLQNRILFGFEGAQRSR